MVCCVIPPTPPWFSSTIIGGSSIPVGTSQSPSALLSLHWLFDISFSTSYCISVGTPLLEWALLNLLLDLDLECLYFIPDSSPPSLSAMPSIDRLLRWIGAPWRGFVPHHFIPHSSITIISPLVHPALHIRQSSFPGGAPLFPANSSNCLSNSILIHQELTSQFQPFRYHKSGQTTLNSISRTRQARINHKYKECLQLLCAVDRFCVPVFVGPDEMGDLVDDIETMFDWYHSIA